MNPLNKISITIAGILIEVHSPLSAAGLGIENRMGAFFTGTDNPVARVSLRWEESTGSPSPRGELIYNPGSVWRMYRSGDMVYAAINYLDDGTDANTISVLRANSSWDDLTLTERRTGSHWRSLINFGAGELILRTKIILTGGLVFHSSGIDDNGRGIVFVGHSEAGKSTQSRLWGRLPGVIEMNDDRMAVRPHASGGAECFGTPWGGTAGLAKNHQAPLSALILLEKACTNKIERLSPSVSASMLLARSFLPYWDKSLMSRAVNNLSLLLESVPVYRLCCRPEPEIVSLVRSVL